MAVIDKLYEVVDGLIPPTVIASRNTKKLWKYGYDEKYDVVVISKDGTIGDIYNINGLHIALPKTPSKVIDRGNKWKPEPYPKELSRLKTVFDWNASTKDFKMQWIDYIEEEFDRRDVGFWFKNKGVPTYITGSHYMYIQWSKIDVGLPDFRESNRIFFIFWEACKADNRSYGMIYLKNRRSGFSYMSSSEADNIGTISSDARIGICSKTGADAKKMFTDKVVPIYRNYPFFFKPVQDGMDNPKTELAFRIPAKKITKKNMYESEDDSNIESLDTSIDWKNTDDNSYDGEKLKFLVEDESGKLEKPNNILNGWRVRKTCLRLGRKITGKCMMGSTVNALAKGGGNFKQLYYNSLPTVRDQNGQTKSGLYSLFIPMQFNLEGFIDEYGHAVIYDPEKPVMGIDGEMINIGAVTYWKNEVDSKMDDADSLNEHYRQFPMTENHAFRDESKQSIFNLEKIYSQVDYNDSIVTSPITRGNFHWRGGILDTEVIWTPDRNGRFHLAWIPPKELQNNRVKKNGIWYPGNEELGAFGCDSYDISGTVDGSGSNGSLHGLTSQNLHDNVPSMRFFLEYIARPQTAEIFYEEVLMACIFFGMPNLIENNKPRLLNHFNNRGYRGFSMNRPDKPFVDLSKSEKEVGGIPNTSEDVKQMHASAIKSYIEQYVGFDKAGEYRDPDIPGDMYFERTLNDWARFDISNRTKFDASISSGLAIMAVRKHMYMKPKKENTEININFVKYNQSGLFSKKFSN